MKVQASRAEDGVENSVDSVEESMWGLRRRVYLCIHALALLGSCAAFFLNEIFSAATLFSRAVLIGVSLSHLTMMGGLWRGWFSLRVVEVSMMVVAVGTLLGVLFYALHVETASPNGGASIVIVYLWLPITYPFIFFVFKGYRALLAASLVLALVVAVSTPYGFRTLGEAGPLSGFAVLGELYVSNAIIIAVLFFFDVLQRRAQAAELEASEFRLLAHTDALTGALNRRGMGAVIASELHRTRRYGSPFSVVILDIDHFKGFNDAFGHDQGDVILTELSRVVSASLRESDHFGRWGGEEFLALLPETSLPNARKVAEAVRKLVEAHSFTHDHRVNISVGVAAYRLADTQERVVKRADLALYLAKRRGRNRVVDETELTGLEDEAEKRLTSNPEGA